ncbi:hypothetical protein HUS97_30715, partial [Pseudomonas protegens]|nr:hypothetical protein [Pseudomonas protegens]
MHAPSPCAPVPVETPWRIFLVFLRLGLSSSSSTSRVTLQQPRCRAMSS